MKISLSLPLSLCVCIMSETIVPLPTTKQTKELDHYPDSPKLKTQNVASRRIRKIMTHHQSHPPHRHHNPHTRLVQDR